MCCGGSSGCAAGSNSSELLSEFFAGLIAGGRILGEGFEDDLLEVGGHGRIEFARGNGLGVDDFVGDGGDGFAGERLIAGG